MSGFYIDGPENNDIDEFVFYSVKRAFTSQDKLPSLLPPLLSDFSREKYLIQKFFRFGLYEDLLYLSNSINFSARALSFICSVIYDRELHRLTDMKNAYFKSNFNETLRFSGLEQLEFNILPKENLSKEQFHVLEELDFNKNYVDFVIKYCFFFNIEGLRNRSFFRKRYPVPFVIKNFSYFLFKISLIENDSQIYLKYVNEMNDAVSDKIFIDRFRKGDGSLYSDLSVAELHKLIRIASTNDVFKFFAKSSSRHKNLIIELFRSNYSLRKARDIGHKPKISSVNSENTAICFSGQMRGAKECLPFWSDPTYQNYKSFLSTWDDIGFPRGAEAGRLARMLPPYISSYFSSWSVEDFEKAFPVSFSYLTPKVTSKSLLDDLLSKYNFNNLSYVINDEVKCERYIEEVRGVVDTVHKNQIKMFYNMHMLNAQVSEFELENKMRFENIIWCRPDFKVNSLSLENLNLTDFVYTSRVSDEGRMLDYLMIFERHLLKLYSECYLNLISPNPSKVFGYNHGPRLITDVFLANGYSAMEISNSNLSNEGLKAWTPDYDNFFHSMLEELSFSDFSFSEELKILLKSKM